MTYYSQIREQFINNKIYKKAKDYSKNRNDLETYYNVGKILIEAQGGEERAKYGNGLIKEYSKRLTDELGSGYDITTLKRMRKFYIIIQKGAAMLHQLTWSHYIVLLKLKDINEINYYIDISINKNLSYRELGNKIKNKEYQRLSDDVKNKLTIKQDAKVNDFIKNPIIIKNSHLYMSLSEKLLKNLILEDMDNFLMELGEGFSYIKNEYKIKIGNSYNYIDLFLFNYIYNCFVIIELKVTELKKEHIGQIQTYMNYVDKNIKRSNQEDTIGIIICKKDKQSLTKRNHLLKQLICFV